LAIAEKKIYGYQERDEEKRKEFKLEISQTKVEERVYIDESGMDNREDYGYGWNERGKRFHDLKSGKRSLRVSIMSGLCQGKLMARGGRVSRPCPIAMLIAPLTFEGSCNRSVFEKWLEEKLLTQLEPGKVLILDNATFHQGEKIKELVESAGCKLQYLPPYSPDLNKIEHCWFPIKNRVRKSQGSIEDFRDRVDYAVKLTS
jgi:transposase